MDSQKHDEAVKHYSDLLTLDPLNVSDVIYKRSKARALRKSWNVALIDAEKVRVDSCRITIETDLSVAYHAVH